MGADDADRRLPFAHGGLTAPFARRVVTIAPGRSLPYEATVWRDAIVVVARGVVELEVENGTRQQHGQRAVFWLDGLPLRALHNVSSTTVVLIAVARRG